MACDFEDDFSVSSDLSYPPPLLLHSTSRGWLTPSIYRQFEFYPSARPQKLRGKQTRPRRRSGLWFETIKELAYGFTYEHHHLGRPIRLHGLCLRSRLAREKLACDYNGRTRRTELADWVCVLGRVRVWLPVDLQRKDRGCGKVREYF